MTASLYTVTSVTDPDAWQYTDKSAAAFRKEGRLVAASVHQDPDDPNAAIIFHQFADISAACGYIASLREQLHMANVDYVDVEIWCGEDVEHAPEWV